MKQMVTEGGHKSSEVARSLGINPNQLYSWKHKFGSNCRAVLAANLQIKSTLR